MDRNLLPAIAAFAEVARAGSFTRAAAQMSISPSALSQIIRTLEKRLDIRLLNRSTRSVSVTEDGRRLLAEVSPGLAMITDAVGNLGASNKRPTGELRINTSGFAARTFLEPHLGEFRRRYPLVHLEIIIDDGLGNIIGEGCRRWHSPARERQRQHDRYSDQPAHGDGCGRFSRLLRRKATTASAVRSGAIQLRGLSTEQRRWPLPLGLRRPGDRSPIRDRPSGKPDHQQR